MGGKTALGSRIERPARRLAADTGAPDRTHFERTGGTTASNTTTTEKGSRSVAF
jgi:hypothetical protein